MADYISLGFNLDAGPAKKELDSLDSKAKAVTSTFTDQLDRKGSLSVRNVADAFKLANEEAKQAQESAQAFSNIIGGIGKIATSAFGMVTAVLKAPMDLENYLGQLGQKVTQVGGQLDRFGSAYKSMLGSFKPTEGGFGLQGDELKKMEYQFASGATSAEKYGASMETTLKQYANATGNMKWFLGFDPVQGMQLLTDFRKTLGLTAADADPFVKQMSIVGKNANMTDKQFFGLSKQVSGLSKAYGLSGKASQQFVKDSLAVGAAVSHLGMDAQTTIAKMNEVASGSEQGLISSLLLGFKPGDTKGQLAAFQAQAKNILSIADSAGPQFAPYLIKELSGPMGMGQFGTEDIRRLGSGLDVAGQKKDATDILADILEQMKNGNLKDETAYNTFERDWAELKNALEKMLLELFSGKDLMKELKTLIGVTLPGLIRDASSVFKSISHFFGEVTLTKLALAAAALAAAPKLIGLAMDKLIGAIISNKAKTMGELGGGAASGAKGLLKYIPAVGIGLVAGEVIKKGMEMYGDHINKKADEKLSGANLADRQSKESQYKSALASGDQGKIERAKRALDGVSPVLAGSPVTAPKSSPSSSAGSLEDKIKGYAKKHGLPPEGFFAQIMQESKLNPNAVSRAGAQGLGQLMPATSKGMGVTNPFDIDQNLEASASIMERLVKKYNGDYSTALAAYNAGEGNVASGRAAQFKETQAYVAKLTPAYTGGKPGDLNKVHDEGANVALNDIRAILSQILNGGGSAPALAGSPTGYQNPASESMVSKLFGGL